MNILFIVVSCILGYLLYEARKSLELQKERERNRTKWHLRKTGGTRLWSGSNGDFINYDLRSFDGGRTWVAVELDDEFRMKVLGDAETLYPGLLAHIEGTAALVNSAIRSGPMDITTEDSKMLFERAGFTVTTNNHS